MVAWSSFCHVDLIKLFPILINILTFIAAPELFNKKKEGKEINRICDNLEITITLSVGKFFKFLSCYKRKEDNMTKGYKHALTSFAIGVLSFVCFMIYSKVAANANLQLSQALFISISISIGSVPGSFFVAYQKNKKKRKFHS
jgi:hypothetical protein